MSTGSCGGVLPEDRFVRGLAVDSELLTDDKIAAVAKQIFGPGDPAWRDAKAADIEVGNVSGGSGSSTFKVALLGASPPAFALHCRPQPGAAEPDFMSRMGAAGTVFAEHGCGPARLAHGSNWFVEVWAGAGKKDLDSLVTWEKIGRTLGKVHQIPVDWFDQARQHIHKKLPQATHVPPTSSVWPYLARFETVWGCLSDADIFDQYAKCSTAAEGFAPRHRLAAKCVTCHGDYHPGNLVLGDDGELVCVDFEFTCAGSAAHDLACAVARCGSDYTKKKSFMHAYLKELGEPESEADDLILDATLMIASIWDFGGKLAIWEVAEMESPRLLSLIDRFKTLAEEVRKTPKLRKQALDTSFVETLQIFREEMKSDAVYKKLQEDLVSAGGTQSNAIKSQGTVTKLTGTTVSCVLASQKGLALQVRIGTDRCEIATLNDSMPGKLNQQWTFTKDNHIQHTQTGWCLATKVQYLYIANRGQGWAENSTELYVAPYEDSDEQRWILDAHGSKTYRCCIRHCVDGRVLDVNFWLAEPGQGVNVNLAHSNGYGQAWAIKGAVMDASFQSMTCDAPTEPLTTLPESTKFRICVAKSRTHCIGVEYRGTEQPPKILLQDVDARDDSQLFMRVGPDRLMHCESGNFMHTRLHYATAHNIEATHEGNGSEIILMPSSSSDDQRWVYSEPSFHRGKVLRHYKDGRGVEVHGWPCRHGQSMGCEHAIHEECKGSTYVFVPDQKELDPATPVGVAVACLAVSIGIGIGRMSMWPACAQALPSKI
jgi:hypothetical protein